MDTRFTNGNLSDEPLTGSGGSGMMDGIDTSSVSLDELDKAEYRNPNANQAGGQTDTYARTGQYDQTNPYSQTAQTGQYNQSNAYSQTGTYGAGTGAAAQPYTPIRQANQENVALGVIGAVVGTALGILVWCLIGMAGYISSLGGLAIIAGAFFGYLLCAKDVSKTGLVVIIVLVVFGVFIGTRLSCAINIHQTFQEILEEMETLDGYSTENRELAIDLFDETYGLDIEASTFDIFLNFNDHLDACDALLSTDYTVTGTMNGEYHKNLALGYVYTALGATAFIGYKKKR